MDSSIVARFRQALTARRKRLAEWVRESIPASGEGLTGWSNGGADADVLTSIDEALTRIDAGTFGQCTLCEGEVEEDRLALDFTTCVCLSHYTEDQIRTLERDLELAAAVHRHLLPCCVPAVPRVQMAARSQPAHLVGGDYYDFFCYRNDMQGVAMADVMGNGLPAGMLMANLQASLRILGPEHEELDTLAVRLNELFSHNLKTIRFISLFLLALDVETESLQYCNAGHHPPLRWEAASQATHWLRPTGPAIGVLNRPTFQSASVPFRPGDVLLLYTDGLVEARNAGGEAFGEERLAHYVAAHHRTDAESLLEGLWTAATGFADGHIHDDVSLVVLKQEDAG